jgi:hypothetical protein
MFVALVPIHKTGADFSEVKGSQTGRREDKKRKGENKEKEKKKWERNKMRKEKKVPTEPSALMHGEIKRWKI